MSLADKMMSNVFVNGQRNSPTASGVYEADVTELMKVYSRLKSECDYRLTFNTVMLKVMVEGLKVAPRLNAHFPYNHTATSGKLIIKKHIDVSMAICKSDGMTFQMKLDHLEDKSLKEISTLAADARERLEKAELDEVMFEVSRQRIIGEMSRGKIIAPWAQAICGSFGKGKVVHLSKTLKSDFLKLTGKKPLQPESSVKMEEFNEGSVCFTNWGAICETPRFNVVSAPMLYPQVFLFSVGKVREETYAYEDENGNIRIGTKQILPLGLNFDHKIGGFHELIPFISKLEEIFNNPEVICSW
jgi:pyruvate dehydrogenase E2 component (dihydrolipoamide acetyltransferase)